MDFLFALLFVIIVLSILHPNFRNIVLEAGNKLGALLKDAFQNKKNILKELFYAGDNSGISATKLRVYYIEPNCSTATPTFKIKVNGDKDLEKVVSAGAPGDIPTDKNEDCFYEFTIPEKVNVKTIDISLEDKQKSSDLKPIALVLYNDKVNVWSKVTNLKPSSNVFNVKEEIGKSEEFANQRDYRLEFFTVNP